MWTFEKLLPNKCKSCSMTAKVLIGVWYLAVDSFQKVFRDILILHKSVSRVPHNTLLNFWIKLTQKGYFRTKNMKITIKFYIFKLIYILIVSFNKFDFWNKFLVEMRKKWTSLHIERSSYSIILSTKFSA